MHRLLLFGIRYLFEGVLRPGPMRAMSAIQAAYQALMEATCDAHEDKKDEEAADRAIEKLHATVVAGLCEFAKDAPTTERATIVHIMLHVPATIRRWNSVRNFWCYAGERYTMGCSLVH